MGFDHEKENMIRQLVEMKERINQTIIMIDKADNDKELLMALMSSPMSQHIMKKFGEEKNGNR